MLQVLTSDDKTFLKSNPDAFDSLVSQGFLVTTQIDQNLDIKQGDLVRVCCDKQPNHVLAQIVSVSLENYTKVYTLKLFRWIQSQKQTIHTKTEFRVLYPSEITEKDLIREGLKIY